jgi:tRNA-specific 2-thiouridylase
MTKGRVAVAMSGGVDSSLAAALLKEAGYEVSGAYMELWSDPNRDQTIRILKQTCQLLNIPLHRLDLREEFQSHVIDYFCREYSAGCTPNPCVFCNQHIKFGCLLNKALQMGADYLATGHYARVEYSRDKYFLLKAVEQARDQSYFLYTLGQKHLQHLLFPLGDLQKAEVRKLATNLGLPASNRRSSQDICFITNNDYRAFIAKYVSLKSGDIVDTKGKVLGRHSGLAQYTVGQRQGLGLSSKERLYILKLDATNNRLVVGTRDQLSSNALVASQLSWVSGKAPQEAANITAKLRYRAREVSVTLHLNDGAARVDFQQPRPAIAPGQSIVFYQDDVVLGGGIIEATEWSGH